MRRREKSKPGERTSGRAKEGKKVKRMDENTRIKDRGEKKNGDGTDL